MDKWGISWKSGYIKDKWDMSWISRVYHGYVGYNLLKFSLGTGGQLKFIVYLLKVCHLLFIS